MVNPNYHANLIDIFLFPVRTWMQKVKCTVAKVKHDVAKGKVKRSNTYHLVITGKNIFFVEKSKEMCSTVHPGFMARKHLAGRELKEKVKRSVAVGEKKGVSLFFFKICIYNYKRESSFSVATHF